MSASNAVPAQPVISGKPTGSDVVFLAFLIALLIAVALLGRLTFREGLKTEESKAQAEALIAWMKEVPSRRQAGPDFSPTGCAYKAPDSAEPATWSGCAQALFSDRGPLSAARNAFSGKPLQFVERCSPGDADTVGQLVIEKVVPTAPGSAIPVVVSPLAGDDRIDQRLLVRVQICDKGGYAIRVGETDF